MYQELRSEVLGDGTAHHPPDFQLDILWHDDGWISATAGQDHAVVTYVELLADEAALPQSHDSVPRPWADRTIDNQEIAVVDPEIGHRSAAVGLYQERCWWVGYQLGIEIQAILFSEEVFSRAGKAAGGSGGKHRQWQGWQRVLERYDYRSDERHELCRPQPRAGS